MLIIGTLLILAHHRSFYHKIIYLYIYDAIEYSALLEIHHKNAFYYTKSQNSSSIPTFNDNWLCKS